MCLGIMFSSNCASTVLKLKFRQKVQNLQDLKKENMTRSVIYSGKVLNVNLSMLFKIETSVGMFVLIMFRHHP